MLKNFILFISLMGSSAFFSGMEAAIFSISRFRLKTLLFENKKGAQILSSLRKTPQKTLITILLSNDLVNIGAASVATIFLNEIVKIYNLNVTWAFFLETIAMTSILLIFGEITPKVIAFSNAEFFALRLGKIIELATRLFEPVAWVSERIIRKIAPIEKTTTVSEDEIKYMLDEARKIGILEEKEERIVKLILQFGKRRVREIMIPKEKVVGIHYRARIEEAKELMQKTKHSRLCVYDEKGNIQGVIYAKDIFLNPDSLKTETALTLMRKPHFVSEEKFVDDLLLEFRKKGIHFGVVLNRQNEFAGIVTLNDILSFLFYEL
uniref:HlyC/CorC family transporter n=1 Tax=candidate division WOR-3 bacterium TaxID=2052148 RepID=A0A7C4TH76_UNCW3